MHVAAFHPLTPGNPAYGLVKIGAVGSLFAVRYALTRRSRRAAEAQGDSDGPPEQAPAASTHPVSATKAKRRRKRRP